MAQVQKYLTGIIASSCLLLSLTGKALAQSIPDIDLDRATVQNTVNLQRYLPVPSDLSQSDNPLNSQASPTNSPDDANTVQPLRPAIRLPGDKSISGGNFTVPADTTPGETARPAATTSAAAPTASSSAGASVPTDNNGRTIAQSAPPSTNNDIVPIDLTPVRLPERNNTFNGFDAFKTKGMSWLPARFFFDVNVENSVRFELNTFQTNRHYLSDFVYRILPNVTVGYAVTRKTRVSANYFFLRDQYALRNRALSRNFQSVGARIDHDIKLNEKTTLTTGFMPRVLFIDVNHQPGIVYNDLLPSAVVTRQVRGGVIYGSFIGQIRFRDILAKFQEGDEFYSCGGAWRRGKWIFLADSTLITNFGNRHLRQGPNNQNIIMTFEAGRKILPAVTAFVRTQPIFNMGANHTPGYAGFNFRVFGGLRAEVGKPPIYPIKLKS